MAKNETLAIYNTKTKALYYNLDRASTIENRSLNEIKDNRHFKIIDKNKLAEMMMNKEIEVKAEYR